MFGSHRARLISSRASAIFRQRHNCRPETPGRPLTTPFAQLNLQRRTILHRRVPEPQVLRARYLSRQSKGANAMADANRRTFLRALALSAGGLASTQSFAAANDGRAAGYEAAQAADFMRTV